MNRLESKLEKIGRDPIITAKAVGLRYAVNSEKGFYRLRKNGDFSYVDENRKIVRDKEILDRIKKLVIPPAWENVWISPFENGHLQATGNDVKGRKQYRYHQNWSKIRNQSKFQRLQNFASALPSIRKKTDSDLNKIGLPYEKVVALVVKLIEMTNIRIGNDAYKKLYGSFGLTTLQNKHVKFDKQHLFFEFIGKKGIKHKVRLQSRKLVNLVRKCKEIPGQDLFQYYDDDGEKRIIGSSDINNYLKEITGEDFTAKDFRVWTGSVHALCQFLEADIPENQSQCNKTIIEVLDNVASKLGNTRTVCKKYYVHPTVIAAYERGTVWNYKPRKNSGKLAPEEKALVRLLERETLAEVIG